MLDLKVNIVRMESYVKMKELGRGTFGVVYLCARLHNNQKFVVKEISGDLNSTQLQTAKNEVAVLKKLKHPNVIQYFDSFIKNGVFRIAMGYARHGNLYDLICKHKPNHFFTIDKILSIWCQIVMGVEHIHSKKIIHRDLKCENIFVSGAQADVIKIGDFGISKHLTTNNNKANTVIGTTNYLAPEMCDGQPYDTKSDIWSMGCILFELCALERLFDGSIGNMVLAIKSGKKKSINVEMYGHDLQRLIDIATQLNPSYRPSATNFLADSFIMTVKAKLMLNLGNCA